MQSTSHHEWVALGTGGLCRVVKFMESNNECELISLKHAYSLTLSVRVSAQLALLLFFSSSYSHCHCVSVNVAGLAMWQNKSCLLQQQRQYPHALML